MNKTLLALTFLLSCCLVGCFDMTETITVNEDGSGGYEKKIDMTRSISGLKDMLAAMGKDLGSKEEKVSIDTTILFANMVDTVASLSAKEKEVLKQGYATSHINSNAGEITMTIICPFKNAEAFNMIQDVFARKDDSFDFFGKAMKTALDQAKKQLPETAQTPEKNETLDQLSPNKKSSSYRYMMTNAGISKIFIPGDASPAANDKSDGLEGMPEMMKDLLKIRYTTIVQVKKPIKSVDGKNAAASEDKKTVTFKKEMDLDATDSKEETEFSVLF